MLNPTLQLNYFNIATTLRPLRTPTKEEIDYITYQLYIRYGNQFKIEMVNISTLKIPRIQCIECGSTRNLNKHASYIIKYGCSCNRVNRRMDEFSHKWFWYELNKYHGEQFDFLISDYIENKNDFKLTCIKCGGSQQINYQSDISKIKCKTCNNATLPNITDNNTILPNIVDNNTMLLYPTSINNEKLNLYIVHLFNESESFIKIGTTKQTDIKKRFNGEISKLYNYNILSNFSGEPNITLNLENFIHNNLKKYKYKPQYRFGGFTECYSEEIKNDKFITNIFQLNC